MMIIVPTGAISLRDNRIKHSWRVEISSFLLAKYPVTQDLFYSQAGKSPSTFKGDRNPVENVSWYDVISFCNFLSGQEGISEYYSVRGEGEVYIPDPESKGYRLPTDAEWQYACQAGSKGVRYGELDKIAWYRENSNGRTRQVGGREPNAWGLYDMLGNVWEWCWDMYDEKAYGSYRIFRGGGWSDDERGCLASNRRRGHPDFKIDDLGFRLARNT